MDVRGVSVPTDTLAPSGATNAYVVGGADALLVDPGARTEALDRAAVERDVGHVLVTHAHPDHAGGVAHYADAHDATVWARAGREDRFERATGVRPDRTFRDGTTLETGTGTVTVVDAPGHAPDHVALSVAADEPRSSNRERAGRAEGRPRSNAMLTGDLAVAEGSVVVDADEGDMRAYLTSLRRLYARAPAVLHPGHGPEIRDPRETIRRLLSHRLERERRVLAAVRDGARTPDEIVDAAYDRDLAGVRHLARGTVVAHLEKLAVEGSVEWDGERAAVR